jgi:hypothetical protein
MSDKHSPIRALKQKWEEEEAARDKQEERAQQAFLEAEANQTFAPIEDFLIRLSKVLSPIGELMEIDAHSDPAAVPETARMVNPRPATAG